VRLRTGWPFSKIVKNVYLCQIRIYLSEKGSILTAVESFLSCFTATVVFNRSHELRDSSSSLCCVVLSYLLCDFAFASL
jgi:hypothetical protein